MIKVFDRLLVLLANIMASVEEERTKTIYKGISICEDAIDDLKAEELKLEVQIERMRAQIERMRAQLK